MFLSYLSEEQDDERQWNDAHEEKTRIWLPVNVDESIMEMHVRVL